MPTTLITGANKGIGLEICAQLMARGDDVIAVCRTSGPELSALGVRIIEGVDVSDAKSWSPGSSPNLGESTSTC